MSGKTNELISLSKSVSNNFNKRELDVLLSTGEQVSCALISGALKEIGLNSKSFMNWQIPILTEGENNNARIINMSINKINDYLSNGGIAVVPGYQGISSLGEITTIGRVVQMQLQLRLQKSLIQIVVKFILMLKVYIQLIQIKFQ